MKIEDCQVGQNVKGTNMFGLSYVITAVLKTVVHVEHRTGDKIMRGGKMIEEVFTYRNVRPSSLTPA